jgi:dihydroorotate dehydrogenase
MLYQKIAKPLFFQMDPEKAHHLVVDGMGAAGRIPGLPGVLNAMYGADENKETSVDLWGLHFRNPIGLAAGLDKNGQAVAGFSSIGFGFVEVGTITPKPQPGNEKPRIFRLPPDQALINRMGFNNMGADAMAENLRSLRSRSIPVAVNIGKNKATPNERAEEDYRKCIEKLYTYADFFVVNVSSPNTPDLRNLQHGDDLQRLLRAVKEQIAQDQSKHKDHGRPVLIKIAPDLSESELHYTIEAIVHNQMSGVIATNTTLSRDGLTHANARETGGLSGRPLFKKSTEMVRSIYRMTGGKLSIIGSGGIFSAQDAYEKIRAGASMVEIYTALIYEGPALIKRLNRELKELLQRDGFTHISQAVGADAR